jgi:macrolide-specific efflux system membrane fusion protein
MTKSKKALIYIGIIAVLVVAGGIMLRSRGGSPGESVKEVSPVMGTIQMTITATGTVQPQNRLEIKPPINGRIDRILVKEGEAVKAGEVLALMSSTERAALLDAAQAQGPEAVRYWEDVYKATPLLSPIDGDVIVSKDEPGQTVTSSDVVVVLSDHLIVQAQVDETDIGKVVLGQEATLSLDAYPQIKIRGKVDHIYYESLTVNNVTIYQVDIVPEKVPPVFRSGMSATVTILEKAKENVLTLPSAAIRRGKEGVYVLLRQGKGTRPVERKVETGISDEKNTEIVSGLGTGDTVLMTVQKYRSAGGRAAVNPLSPIRRR